MAEKATTDDSVVYTELTDAQVEKAQAFVNENPVSYEVDEASPGFFRIFHATDQQIQAFEAALA